MRLDALVAAADDVDLAVRGDPAAVDVTSVLLDSRLVVPGALFCCVRGSRTDGHDFARAAVENGASALLVERPLDLGVPELVVADARASVGPLASALHRHPSRALTVVGVTGTNGKTTVTHLLGAVFERAGMPCEVIGTLSGRGADQPPTTPDAPQLQEALAAAVDNARRAVAMEVSSHALAQHRVRGTTFAAAVFTNLGRDHLDFHRSIDEYFEAKASFFTPDYTQLGVINADDEHGVRLLARTGIRMVPFSIRDASDVRIDARSSEFTWRGTRLRVGLGGRFNVMNALAAATVASELGIDSATVHDALADVDSVAGRWQVVDEGQDFTVLVDYAHTPDAIATVLEAAREIAGGNRVVIVFGAGGDKDRLKRPLMGEVAAVGADQVVLTSDNPRSEDPLVIIDAVKQGIPTSAPVAVEPDRRRAIELAVSTASRGDVVVIAGKGHETHQEIAGERFPFDDHAVAREALRARAGAS